MPCSTGARRKLLFLPVIFLFAFGWVHAQEHKSAPANRSAQKSEHKTSQESSKAEHATAQEGGEGGPSAELAEASREAAGEDEHAQFKQSASVRWLAQVTGMAPLKAYWVSVVLNFVIIALLIGLLMKAQLPAAFRNRTGNIRKALEEARAASAQAQQRLSEIEARLAKLDAEIAAMVASAEDESRAEEERIRAAAEQDKRKIIEAAEQEIAASANLARRELKAYVAELAVALAEKRIQVSPSADEELVRSFVDQLGEDGKP